MNAHEHLDLELVELLAGDADPPRRAALAERLRTCDVCRARYDELAGVLADVTTAAPPVSPPLGFETRVAARLVAAGPIVIAEPTRRSRWWSVAAATLLVASAGALAGNLIGADDDTDGTPLALVRTGTDDTVGTVSFAETDDGPIMVVAVFDAPAGVAYRCRMHLTDGTVVDSAPWSPAERGAWVLDVPGGVEAVASIEIVTADGDRVWSSTAG